MDDNDTGVDDAARAQAPTDEGGPEERAQIDDEPRTADDSPITSDGNGSALATEPSSHAVTADGTEGAEAPSNQTEDQEAAEKRSERPWVVPLAVGVFIVVVIAAVAILLLLNQGTDRGRNRRGAGRGTSEQADWKITSFSIDGKAGKGKNQPAPRRHEQPVEKLVRRWHDALYLFPSDLRGATQRYFTNEAARALRSSEIALPKTARDIRTRRRTARIAIEAGGPARAAAIVDVVATGKSRAGTFRSASESRLWLERRGSNWKVVAFDFDLRPLPTNQSKGNDKNLRKDENRSGKKDGRMKRDAGKDGAS